MNIGGNLVFSVKVTSRGEFKVHCSVYYKNQQEHSFDTELPNFRAFLAFKEAIDRADAKWNITEDRQ